mmetsp:Transcript_62256/g.157292  ORF Transcript_62256/g.157292 Transcript_62256/m.157292 type:complete len:222 (+) Transcript_62256:336-1001(+)
MLTQILREAPTRHKGDHGLLRTAILVLHGMLEQEGRRQVHASRDHGLAMHVDRLPNIGVPHTLLACPILVPLTFVRLPVLLLGGELFGCEVCRAFACWKKPCSQCPAAAEREPHMQQGGSAILVRGLATPHAEAHLRLHYAEVPLVLEALREDTEEFAAALGPVLLALSLPCQAQPSERIDDGRPEGLVHRAECHHEGSYSWRSSSHGTPLRSPRHEEPTP